MRAVAALIAVLGLSVAAAPLAKAAADAPRPDGGAQAQSPDVLTFDIPRLPLFEALQRYSSVTRLSVFYETSLISQGQSSPVQGQFTPQAALDQLLAGTGLAARFTEHRSFVLMVEPASAALTTTSDPAVQQRYEDDVQARIVHALCAQPAIEAGHYRLALRFSVNDAQRIDQLQVRATERPDLEPAIRSALAGLPVGAPPPGTAQPAIMLLTPESSLRYGGCRP